MKYWTFNLLNYIGLLALVAGLAGYLGRFHWTFDLFSHFRPQYALVFLSLLVVAILSGSKRWIVLWLGVFLINGMPVFIHLLPDKIFGSFEGSRQASLKIMLFNVNSSTGNPQLVAETIAKENPDILVLQELSERWINQLGATLGRYSYQIVKTRDDNFGIGIFSKLPQSAQKILYLGKAEVPSARMDLVLPGRTLTVFSTHPLPPVSEEGFLLRNDQLEEVAGYLRTVPNDLILAGDLNISPWSVLWGDFIKESRLTDSSRGLGIFPTWSPIRGFPLIPIDHFLYRGKLDVISKSVGDFAGSDHFPVILEIGL